MSLDRLVASDKAALHDITNKLAHILIICCHPGHLTPRFGDECSTELWCCRRLECCYRRTWYAEDLWFRVDITKHEEYQLGHLNECMRSLVVMALSIAAAQPRSRRHTDHTMDSFAEFFHKKVCDVRSATAGLPPFLVLESDLLL